MSSSMNGQDTEGRKYRNLDDMWRHELKGDVDDPAEGWYGKAISYWKSVPATVDGVLGGLEKVHPVDVKESAAFIDPLLTKARKRGLDCGAGIGRLTETLMFPLGIEVADLIEPLPHMTAAARQRLPAERLGEIYETSLQKAQLQHMYDLIIVQWVAIYLTDDDLAAFFASCKRHLNDGGIIFFKENCSSDNSFTVDKDDSSLTRSDPHYREIFKAAGVTVVKDGFQRSWPEELYKVRMYALV
jgi:protein N-terminal methyltransferase